MAHKPKTVTVNWTHPETEEECEVECSVDPGQPLIMWGDNAQPGISAGIDDILSVKDEKGVDRPDLVDYIEEHKDEREWVEEKVVLALDDEARDY